MLKPVAFMFIKRSACWVESILFNFFFIEPFNTGLLQFLNMYIFCRQIRGFTGRWYEDEFMIGFQQRHFYPKLLCKHT